MPEEGRDPALSIAAYAGDTGPCSCGQIRGHMGWISCALAGQRLPSDVWGHKITISIYLSGSLEDAGDVSDQVCGFINEKDPHGFPYVDVDFVGVRIETVQDEPKDQVAS